MDYRASTVSERIYDPRIHDAADVGGVAVVVEARQRCQRQMQRQRDYKQSRSIRASWSAPTLTS